jgi:hypothetical protein
MADRIALRILAHKDKDGVCTGQSWRNAILRLEAPVSQG